MAQSIVALLPLSVTLIAVRNFTFKMNILELASALVVGSGLTSLVRSLPTQEVGQMEAIGKQSLSSGQIVNFLIIKEKC